MVGEEHQPRRKVPLDCVTDLLGRNPGYSRDAIEYHRGLSDRNMFGKLNRSEECIVIMGQEPALDFINKMNMIFANQTFFTTIVNVYGNANKYK